MKALRLLVALLTLVAFTTAGMAFAAEKKDDTKKADTKKDDKKKDEKKK